MEVSDQFHILATLPSRGILRYSCIYWGEFEHKAVWEVLVIEICSAFECSLSRGRRLQMCGFISKFTEQNHPWGASSCSVRQKIACLYRTRKLMSMHARSHHWSLFRAGLNQSTTSCCILEVHISIILSFISSIWVFWLKFVCTLCM